MLGARKKAEPRGSTFSLDPRLKAKGLSEFEALGGHLARLGVTLQFIADLLAFIQAAHTGAFDRTDVNEDVLAAIRRRDETKTFCGVEPLNCTGAHDEPFQLLYAPTQMHGYLSTKF